MRPIKLSMSAFGPYVPKTVIEFDKLGTNGLYLITGDTGAGKTTIFDAITLALYGKSSGEKRKAEMFRSKYADAQTPTEVELTFAYAGKEYFIKRNPRYERPKKRGDGFTTENENAELHYPDGRIVAKADEVDRAIKEIIRIDYQQFTQIAMIAQGDFLNLLLASTKEREEIFQKIFHTYPYSELQDKLHDKTSELKVEYDAMSASIKQYINGIEFGEDNVLSVKVRDAKSGLCSTEEAVVLLSTLIENDKKEEETLDKELEGVSEELEKITVELTNQENWDKARKSLGETQTKIDKAVATLETLENVLKAEEEKKPKVEKIVKQISAIEAELPEYKELDSKIKEKEKLQKNTESLTADLKSQKEKSKALNNEMEIISEERKSLETVDKEKAESESQQKEKKNRRDTIKKVSKELKNLEASEKKLKKAQDAYSKAYEKHSKKDEEYKTLFKRYLDDQAGIIAGGLLEGDPCPVCGSTNHPLKAKKTENAPTKEQLDECKEACEDALKDTQEANEKAAKEKGIVDEKKKAVIGILRETFGNVTIEDAEGLIKDEIEAIEVALEELQKSIDVKQKMIDRKAEIDKKLPEMTKHQNELAESIVEADKTLSANEATLISLKKRIDELTNKLEYGNEKNAVEAKEILQNEKKNIEDAYKQAFNAVSAQKEKIAGYKAAKDEAEKILADAKEVDVEALKVKQGELQAKKTDINNKQKNINARKTSNEKAEKFIRESVAEICGVEEKLRWVKALSDTARGTIKGKEKIMLEAYIQMMYFDRVISKANTRFMAMSGGQYEFKRCKEVEDNRSKSGLDLDVIDHYNGSLRSVKTLSGGESFKASLSLALGLSDVIQSSAGGIKLDTMFVDEGFGALDEESLDQAIRALQNLTEGNRLVGIISHVAELKERIDKQIIVKKEKNCGSSVKIIR